MNYLPHLLAVLRQNKQSTVLSVLNLIITISVFFTVFVYVKWDFSHNRVWPGSENIYRVVSEDIPVSGPTLTNTFFVDSGVSQLKDYVGEQATDITTVAGMRVTADAGQHSQSIDLYLVDKNFLDFFQLEAVQGDLEYAITTPGYIAMEEKRAKEVFGTSSTSYINNTIVLKGEDTTTIVDGMSTKVPGGEREFVVGAIYTLPSPITSATRFRTLAFRDDYAKSISASYSQSSSQIVTIWIKTESKGSAQSLAATLDGYTGLQGGFGGQPQLSLEPLRDIYFNHNDGFPGSSSGNLSKTLVIGFIGLIVLVAGCSNSISASLAEALRQLKSTGVRKAFGASRSHIFMLNLATQMALILIALLPALAITEALIGVVATQLTEVGLLGAADDISINLFTNLPELLLIALCLSLVNCFFPGIYLTRVKPSLLLGNTLVFTRLKGVGVRVFLVIIQFAAAIFLITLALSFTAQLQLSANRDLGFNTNNLIFASRGPSQDVNTEALLEAIALIPSVQKVGTGTAPVSSIIRVSYGEPPQLVRTTNDERGLQAHFYPVGFDFFDTVGIPIIGGREFSVERDASASEQALTNGQPVNIVLDENAMRSLGFSDPEEAIGQIIYERRGFGGVAQASPQLIIGVVKSNLYHHLKEQAGMPEVYRLDRSGNTTGRILVRHDGSNEAFLRQEIDAAWMNITGFHPSYYADIDDTVAGVYASEAKTTRLLGIVTVFTIVLSCIGMYGLVSSTLHSQSRFIAIRSVFGAGKGRLMALYCMRFSKPILIAALLSCPAGMVFAFRWVEQFPSQLGKAWVTLIAFGATAFILLLAWGVVCLLTATVLRRRPSRVLRYE